MRARKLGWTNLCMIAHLCLYVLSLSTLQDWMPAFRSHALQHVKNFLTKHQVLMNVRNCTKRAYGASMPCRMTCYKPVIHSWRKIEKPSPPVRLLFVYTIPDWGADLSRDKEDQAQTCSVSCSDGHEWSRSTEWCTRRPEFGRRSENTSALGREAPERGG